METVDLEENFKKAMKAGSTYAKVIRPTTVITVPWHDLSLYMGVNSNTVQAYGIIEGEETPFTIRIGNGA